MKKLMIKFCICCLERKYRRSEQKDIKNQVILNKFRQENSQNLAEKHNIPVEKVKGLQNKVN